MDSSTLAKYARSSGVDGRSAWRPSARWRSSRKVLGEIPAACAATWSVAPASTADKMRDWCSSVSRLPLERRRRVAAPAAFFPSTCLNPLVQMLGRVLGVRSVLRELAQPLPHTVPY
jgi:hypothetical protein